MRVWTNGQSVAAQVTALRKHGRASCSPTRRPRPTGQRAQGAALAELARSYGVGRARFRDCDG
jgi:hypothetical protein